jgi:hypothetical protein
MWFSIWKQHVLLDDSRIRVEEDTFSFTFAFSSFLIARFGSPVGSEAEGSDGSRITPIFYHTRPPILPYKRLPHYVYLSESIYNNNAWILSACSLVLSRHVNVGTHTKFTRPFHDHICRDDILNGRSNGLVETTIKRGSSLSVMGQPVFWILQGISQ